MAGWGGGCTYTLSCRCTCIYLCLIPVSFKFLYPFLPVFTCLYLYLSVFYLYLLVLFTYIYLCLPVLTCIYLCLPVYTSLYLSLPVFTCRIVWGAWTWQRTGRRMTSRECPPLRMSTSPVTRRVPAPGIPVIPVTPASETPEVS